MISYKHTYYISRESRRAFVSDLEEILRSWIFICYDWQVRLRCTDPSPMEISAFKLVKNEVLLKILGLDYDFMMKLLQAQMVKVYLCIKRLERLHL